MTSMAEDETKDTAPAAPDTPTEPAAPAAAEAAATPPAAPAEVLTPKERKQRTRTGKAAKTPARAPSTPEERHEQRVIERRGKAIARRVERQRSRAKTRARASDTTETAPREHQPPVQKTRQGIVVSDRADKTITVRIDVARRHRRYSKIVRTSNTLHAHDETNEAHVGDTVVVRESRPLSRLKRWRLVEVVERAK
jgi:small subunit ribosomal protein S17